MMLKKEKKEGKGEKKKKSNGENVQVGVEKIKEEE